MAKIITITILLIIILFSCSIGGEKYLLPIPIAASNGLPIKNGTFAIYDSSGSDLIINLTYLSGFYYYYTTALSPGWYDIKQKIGSTWYTYLDNVWLLNTFTFISDSVMYYIQVDGSTITKTNDTLSVGSITGDNITNYSISGTDIAAGVIDSFHIRNKSIYDYKLYGYADGFLLVSDALGNVSWAQANVNSIGSNAINSSMIIDNTIDSADIKIGSVTGAIRSEHIKNGSIRTADLEDESVTGTKIQNGSITWDDLASPLIDTLFHTITEYLYPPYPGEYTAYLEDASMDSFTVLDTVQMSATSRYGTYRRITSTNSIGSKFQIYHCIIIWYPKSYFIDFDIDDSDSVVIQTEFRVPTGTLNEDYEKISVSVIDMTNSIGSVIHSTPDTTGSIQNTWYTDRLNIYKSEFITPAKVVPPLFIDIKVQVSKDDDSGDQQAIDLGYIRIKYRGI